MAQTTSTTTGTVIAANPSTMKILSQIPNSMITTTATNSPTIATTALTSTTTATNSLTIATTAPSSTIETIESVQSVTTKALSTTSDIEGNAYLNYYNIIACCQLKTIHYSNC